VEKSSQNPKLSIVVAARNDEHAGDFLRRMQIFVTGMLQHAKIHNLNSELVIVEWNPPAERQRLREALAWPKNTDPCSIRIIEVPNRLHRLYKNADRLLFYQWIAKNVGIRRARGRFVLATNVDLLFSHELVEFLASGKLVPKAMYRIDRYDVRSGIPTNASLTEQLDYCARNIIRVNAREDVVSPDVLDALEREPKFRLKVPRTLYMFWRTRFRSRLRTRDYLGMETTHHSALQVQMRYLKRHFCPPFPLLHLGAAGDFTLLSREDWRSLGGYPELPIHAVNLDSVFCHIAYHNGIPERVLQDPMRIYHIEHEPGWLPQWQLKARLDAAGIPMLNGNEYISWINRIYKEKRLVVTNGPDWGLGEHALLESTFN